MTTEGAGMSDTTDEAWHQWRRQGIGGSDIGALLGLSSWASPWSLWADKMGYLPPSPETQRQRIGKRMEAVLAAEFHDATGYRLALEQAWLTHPLLPFCRCTIDAAVVDEPATAIEAEHLDMSDMLGPWEAKTSAQYGWDKIPDNYLAQVRWNMAIMGAQRGWLTVMFAGFRIEHFTIERDADDEAFMLDAAQQFWVTHVEAGIPPEVDGSDATTRALKAVYPETVKGTAVELDDMSDELSKLEEYKALESAASKLAEAAGCIENRIKARMGDAEIGTVGGAPVFTLRPTTRKAYTAPEITYRTLRKATKKDQEAA